MFTLAELDNVIPLVRAIVPPTPQYAWPLLKAQTGVEIVVKHENHTPIGAFKLRGGIVYFDRTEGAGAAALAALTKERVRLQGRRAAVILTGQNIDRTWMQTVLAGGTPKVHLDPCRPLSSSSK
jgi:threonine dehydratase